MKLRTTSPNDEDDSYQGMALSLAAQCPHQQGLQSLRTLRAENPKVPLNF
jgi:hypothetical protein